MNFPSDDFPSVSTNNTLHPTSSSLPSDSEVLKNIKMEPGLPTTTQRLTSYRLPRDLTLGGIVKTERPKKIYMPNLNAQRNKKKDEPVTSRVEPTKSKDSGSRDRGKGRERGRGKGHLIQSVGVWSEGISAPVTTRKYTGNSGNSGTSTRKYLERPKINPNKIVNTEEDKEKLKNLIGDDSADNEDPDEKADYIMLPMNEYYYKKLHKSEFKVDIDTHSDENDIDKKPIISENGEVISVKNEKKVNIEMLKEEKKNPSQQLFDMIENKSNSYILLQFSTLPGLKSEDEKEEPKPKRSNDSRLITSGNNIEDCACNLSDLNSGLLGKLEILRSGKARLRLGENYFDVTTGMHYNALQHVVAAKIDNMSLTGDLVTLGPVTDSLVCSVDVDYLSK